MPIDRDDIDRVREAAALTGDPDKESIRRKDENQARVEERANREVDRAQEELDRRDD
jgi:hypothetical protein